MVLSHKPEERWDSELSRNKETGQIPCIYTGIYNNNFISLQTIDEADKFGK
jgi:hypothetical protein